MSMNTPVGKIVQTTPIKEFDELQSFNIEQYLLAINNIAQGDGARISLQNLISSSISSDVGNLLEIGQDGKLSVKSGVFNLDNGWFIAPNVTVNWSENTLNSIDGEFYLNGVLYPALSNFTVSNVPTTVGANYLYYNFSNEQFEWSVGYPAIDPEVQIANIISVVNFSSGQRFAINTWSYGGIAKNLVEYLDSAVGMILTSGGTISNVTIDDPIMRYPLITQSNIASADFNQDIPSITTQDNYLQAYNHGGTLTFVGNQNEIVPLASGTDNPQYVNKSTGTLTNLAEDKFMNVWMVVLPLAGQNTYTTDYIFVTGDTQYDDLTTAQSANFNDDYTISLMRTLFERFFVAYRFTITFNGSSFTIADYKSVSYSVGEGSGTGGGSTGAGMPVGTIFAHTCSASFVPENSLPCNGGEYTQAQFPILYTNWLVNGNLNTCTYKEYENYISTYGKCGKWGLDTTNGKFKTPYIPDGTHIQQAMTDYELGKCYNASIPNIKANFPGPGENVYANGAASLSGNNGGRLGGSNAPNANVLFNASSYNSIYNDGINTVQTEAVALRYFVVIATGSINQSEMDWSEWASSLQRKANTDMDNLSTTGKNIITSFAFPSAKYDNLSVGANGQTFVAPADGWYVHRGLNRAFSLTNVTAGSLAIELQPQNTSAYTTAFIPASKGDTVGLAFAGGSTDYFRFIYAKGANND